MLRYAWRSPFPGPRPSHDFAFGKSRLAPAKSPTRLGMVLDARGKVADILTVRDAIAKKRSGRRFRCILICVAR